MVSCELPKTLGVMLNQLLNNNSLKGWSIYENKHGQICCNIRFTCGIGSTDSVGASIPAVPVGACSYRRISEKQHTRSITRAIDHNSKKRKLSDNVTSPESHRDVISTQFRDYAIDTPLRVSTRTETIDSDTDIAYSEPPVSPDTSIRTFDDILDEAISETTSSVDLPDISPGVNSPMTHAPIKQSEDIEDYADPSSSVPEPDKQPPSSPTQVLLSPQFNDNQPVKCPCCSQKMSVTHVCSDDSEVEPPHHVPPEPDKWPKEDAAAAIARVVALQQEKMMQTMLTNLSFKS